ncbi:hypothetical protein A0H81_13469 [Grifola frondosa]|uniref:Uncharacterized protein n=1 Tax=Grifola frondosa TaxID=5627 RepID=A0A1C7LRB0_GRIFR|nr:hypothetical protein A0H81_13469 [Grifola frondosa]
MMRTDITLASSTPDFIVTVQKVKNPSNDVVHTRSPTRIPVAQHYAGEHCVTLWYSRGEIRDGLVKHQPERPQIRPNRAEWRPREDLRRKVPFSPDRMVIYNVVRVPHLLRQSKIDDRGYSRVEVEKDVAWLDIELRDVVRV